MDRWAGAVGLTAILVRQRIRGGRGLTVVLLLSLLTACTSVQAQPPSAGGVTPLPKPSFAFAVLGDYPYRIAQVQQLPRAVAQINADQQVDLVFHLGDIGAGARACNTDYYRHIKAEFDKFTKPLVYTFGDNEWTNCSGADHGNHDPLERLATLRRTFIPRAGQTLGKPEAVISQAHLGAPENVTFIRAETCFAAFHAVGSRNGNEPWAGNDKATPQQSAEVKTRSAAATRLIHDTFTTAQRKRCKGLIFATQADMFNGTPSSADTAVFRPIIEALAHGAASYGGPVYLFNGDSHTYNVDQPLSQASPWPHAYHVPPAENLTRVTIDGDDNAVGYLTCTIQPAGSISLI